MILEISQNGHRHWFSDLLLTGEAISVDECDRATRIAQKLVLEGKMDEGKFLLRLTDVGGTVWDTVALHTGELLSGRLRRQVRKPWHLRYWLRRLLERLYAWVADPEDVAESVGHPMHAGKVAPPPVQADALFARPPAPPLVRSSGIIQGPAAGGNAGARAQ
jgi:hypothetical protein